MQLRKVFDNAYRSSLSVIIIDNVEVSIALESCDCPLHGVALFIETLGLLPHWPALLQPRAPGPANPAGEETPTGV